MTNTKPTLARTGLATLAFFGALALGAVTSAEAQPGNGQSGYQKADKNGDGKIGPLERQAAITGKVQRVMLKADKNGDGLIGPFEIRTASGRLSSWLGKADVDRNGFVTRLELRALIAERWSGSSSWSHTKKYKGQNKSKKNQNKYSPRKPAPRPVIRDHRQPTPKPAPGPVIRDHRQPAPIPSNKRPSVKVPSKKSR